MEGVPTTVIPVRLALDGDAPLMARSEAKRLLAGIAPGTGVVLDFAGVDSIGPAFADEVFRVFRQHHREIELLEIHATPQVQQMIRRAQAREA
jgi:hypothetical protein